MPKAKPLTLEQTAKLLETQPELILMSRNRGLEPGSLGFTARDGDPTLLFHRKDLAEWIPKKPAK